MTSAAERPHSLSRVVSADEGAPCGQIEVLEELRAREEIVS